MRQKMGTSLMSAARGASRMSAVSAPANELTDNWLRQLNIAATTGDAKEAHSQLQSVLDFYNKGGAAQMKAIDWDGHRARIHTKNVVDKIHAKYEKFMETSYSVDSAVARCGHSTEKMQALDVAMQYNFMLYFVHYQAHLDQLELMSNIGDIQQLSMLELSKLMPGQDELMASQQEIANLAPEDYNEDGVFTRICTQFSWGTRYTPPFNHSQDAINGIAATMGKLGK